VITKDWFVELGENIEDRFERIWNDRLDKDKDKILRKFWVEKEKSREKRKERMKVQHIEREEQSGTKGCKTAI